jgi:hypothetical protein
MLVTFENFLKESGVFDWSDIDPRAEIEWFKKAYAEELALLHKIFPPPPALRWGLLYWPR